MQFVRTDIRIIIIATIVTFEFYPIKTAQPVPRAKPHKSIGIFDSAKNGVVRQTILNRIVFHNHVFICKNRLKNEENEQREKYSFFHKLTD